MITPLKAELSEKSLLERELEACRQELLSTLERYEYLREKQLKTQLAITEMRKEGMRQWPA